MKSEEGVMDIGRFLDIAATRYPKKTALLFQQERWTYEHLRERVQRLSCGFQRLGVKKGDRVAVAMWNCSELIVIYLASARIGAIFTPLNYRLTQAELSYVIQDASPTVLITDHHCQDSVEGAVSDPDSRENLYSTADKPRALRSYIDLVVPSRGEPAASVDGRDPCQLIYTSGTTGKPKGVLLSHENVIWNTLNMLQVRQDVPEDVALIVGPLFHTAALNSHFTSRLALGATSVIMEKFDPQEMMRIVEQERITAVSGTPTMFILLMENCRPGDYDTSSVTTLTSGSDKCPLPVKKSICEYFPNVAGIHDVYGCTECSPCVTALQPKESFEKSGSVGVPLPFLEVRIVDSFGKDVKTGEVGEIIVRGPNVMMSYLGQPEQTAQALKDGWLYTGDLAWADEDGFVYITDRKKDIIISGGENIAPREVEDHLFSHPSILKAAVIGVPDEKWGERVVAAVIPREGRAPELKEIQAYLKKHLAAYKIPKEMMILDRLPESSMGKIQKQELKKIYRLNRGEK